MIIAGLTFYILIFLFYFFIFFCQKNSEKKLMEEKNMNDNSINLNTTKKTICEFCGGNGTRREYNFSSPEKCPICQGAGILSGQLRKNINQYFNDLEIMENELLTKKSIIMKLEKINNPKKEKNVNKLINRIGELSHQIYMTKKRGIS